MKKILLLLTILCLSNLTLLASARAEAAVITPDIDNAQLAYMGNYTMEPGVWQLTLGKGGQALYSFEIDSNSTKRIAGTYTFDAGNLHEGNYTPDTGTEVAITDATLSIAYSRKGNDYPIYTFQAQLTDATGATHDITADVETMAYDYMMYLYFTMGAVAFDQCLIQLQDAPEEESGVIYEVSCPGGNWEDYTAEMGVIKVTAEDEDGRMVQLLFEATAVASGTYRLSDTYAMYCYLANLATQQYDAYFMSGEAQIEVSGNILSVNGRILAKNGDVYLVNIPIAVPEGEDYRDYLEGITHHASALCVPATKHLRQGRIIIERAQQTYDATGARGRSKPRGSATTCVTVLGAYD